MKYFSQLTEAERDQLLIDLQKLVEKQKKTKKTMYHIHLISFFFAIIISIAVYMGYTAFIEFIESIGVSEYVKNDPFNVFIEKVTVVITPLVAYMATYDLLKSLKNYAD